MDSVVISNPLFTMIETRYGGFFMPLTSDISCLVWLLLICNYPGMDFTADLSLFYSDFAVLVSHTPKVGGVPTAAKAMLDQPGITLLGGDMLASDFILRFPTTAFPAVRKGDQFVISGITYLARENAQPTLDGLEQVCPLAKS